jgi:hypothetical protein
MYQVISHSIFASKSDSRVITRFYILRRVSNEFRLFAFGNIIPQQSGRDNKYKGGAIYSTSADTPIIQPDADESQLSAAGINAAANKQAFYGLSAFSASLAMDASGNLGAGYTVSGSAIYPQLRFATLAALFARNNPDMEKDHSPFNNGPSSMGANSDMSGPWNSNSKDMNTDSGSSGPSSPPSQRVIPLKNGFVPNYSDVNSPNNFNYFTGPNSQRDNSENLLINNGNEFNERIKDSDWNMDSTSHSRFYPKQLFFGDERILARSGTSQLGSPATSEAELVLDPADCFWWFGSTIAPLIDHISYKVSDVNAANVLPYTPDTPFFTSLLFGIQSVICNADDNGSGSDYGKLSWHDNQQESTNLGNVNIPFNNLLVNTHIPT